MNGKGDFIIRAFPIVLMILIFIFYYSSPAIYGTTIKVKVIIPIDPRELFTGDYVNLKYDISTINLEEIEAKDVYWAHKPEFKANDVIYASLYESNDGYWKIDKIYTYKPKNVDVCLKGYVDRVYSNTLFIRWGFEQYFVEEGKGKYLEGLLRKNRNDVSAIIKVDPNTCVGVLKELKIGDQTIK